jgi:hypothetical protein
MINLRVSNTEYEAIKRKADQRQLSMAADLVESGMGRRLRRDA